MRQDAHAFLDQSGSVNADCLAMLHVLVCEVFGGAQRNGLLFGDCFSADQQRANGVHRVHWINCGWTSFGEGSVNALHLRFELIELLAAKRAQPLGKPVSSGRSDRPGPADDHISDRPGGFFEILTAKKFELVWKEALLDQNDLVPLCVKPNRPKRFAFGTSTNLHVVICSAWKRNEKPPL